MPSIGIEGLLTSDDNSGEASQPIMLQQARSMLLGAATSSSDERRGITSPDPALPPTAPHLLGAVPCTTSVKKLPAISDAAALLESEEIADNSVMRENVIECKGNAQQVAVVRGATTSKDTFCSRGGAARTSVINSDCGSQGKGSLVMAEHCPQVVRGGSDLDQRVTV
jgi:hypothetical protein